MDYEYKVAFTNRRGKQETIEAKTERQAIAAGKSWSKNETFKLYHNGELIDMYQNGMSIKTSF